MHTKTIKILMCENEQKPELGPEPWKRQPRTQSHTHENQELRIWRNVHEKKSSRVGAVTISRRLPSPEIIHTVADHIDDPE